MNNNVTNPRKPFLINVGFLVSASIGYYRDFDFFVPRITDEDEVTLREVEGKTKITRTPQGLLVQGDFTGQTQLECVRCLSEYTQELKWEFTELYAFTPDNMTESGLLVPEDAQLDLQPLVREFAILEFPIKPLCRQDCQGLCQECGQNLNEKDCGHTPEPDSPFSALKQILDE